MIKQNTHKGFTIVELLIVIVVIGILAAITIVSYNGVQTRATNTSIIASARQAIEAVQISIASTGNYPGTTHSCLTVESPCVGSGVSYIVRPAVNDTIAQDATLPSTVPTIDSTKSGIIYNYAASRSFNGTDNIQPLTVVYYLKGAGVQCGLSNVANSGGNGDIKSSTTGYTAGASGPTTTCVISIAGP